MAGSGSEQGCFLCTIAREDRDDINLVLHRFASIFVVMNRYPYNSGHLLVAPYEHTADFAGLESEIASEMMAVTQRSVRILSDEYKADGFNTGLNLGQAAGAGVPLHLHAHVVPRWVGDTNYMTVLGETKVLPESLEQTYARLKPYFA